jgi:DNA-3-methyladenine glycosylase II
MTLRGRLVRRYGTPVVFAGDVVHAFPDPGSLARARPAALRALQFSGQKATAIRAVAGAAAGGALDARVLARAGNADVIERLTRLRGLGRWSADWFLARCLGRGDVCPAGDLAVRKAFAHHFGLGRTEPEAVIRARAAEWGPHQNLAIHYLLAGLRLAAASAGGGA